MRKRLSSKLLAVILTIAICATTVLGCLMTVSADTSCYSFGAAEFSEDKSQVTFDVTFTAPDSLSNGFVSGAFAFSEVDADGTDYLVFNNNNITSDDVNVAVEENYVIFDSESAVKTATFTFTVGFSTGVATDKTYQISLSEVELAYNDVEYYIESVTGPVCELKAACEHVFTITGTPLNTDTANGYSVYDKKVCKKCGETFNEYQLVPGAGDTTAVEESNSTICWSADGAYDDTLIDAADGTQDGSEEYPIIINSVEELYSLAIRTPWTDSLNNYYKLADGIENVVLQSADKVSDVMALSGSDEVNTYFTENSGYSWGAPNRITKNAFAGHFDGNGATFYGLYSKNKSVSGLFPIVFCADAEVSETVLSTETPTLAGDNVSVSNLNITNSYIYGATRMGFISGEALLVDCNSWTNYQATTGVAGCYADWYLQVSNCSIYNNYMYSSQSGTGSVIQNGIVAGIFNGFNNYKGDGTDTKITKADGTTLYSGGRFVSIDNCLVYGNTGATGNGYDIALCGQFSRGSKENGNNQIITNSIVLGTDPFYSTANGTGSFSSHSGEPVHFYNIYSDALTSDNMTVTYNNATKSFTTTQIMPITSSDVVGSAAAFSTPNLDWGTTWIVGDTNMYPRLAKPGEEFDTIYWNSGEVATGFADTSAGTADAPIIISTAEEFALLVSDKASDSKTTNADGSPKYFKIADGIKNIVLQPYAYGSDIMALDSAAKTKDYFEKTTGLKTWPLKGWEGACFGGHFDGNGVTVYGAYQKATHNTGLFAEVDAGATIQNIAVRNCYFNTSTTSYNAGVLGALSSSDDYGLKKAGIIYINNATVANCYLYSACTSSIRSGVIFGNAQYDVLAIENCLVYGNDATYGSGVKMSLTGQLDGEVLSSATKPAELTNPVIYVEKNADGTVKNEYYVNTVKNSIILDCDVMNISCGAGWRKNAPGYSYSNVYTNGASGTVTYSNATWTYPEEELKGITASQAMGATAKAFMPNLAWGTDWYCGTITGYPVLAPFATLDASEYSNSALTLIGSNTAYNEDGSFDFNFHFVPEVAGFEPTLYVGTVDCSKFMKLDKPVESCYKDQLGETAIMYTIPNLSARDIDLIWLPTLVTEGSAVLEWGKSEQIALADNARAILAGDYDTADKNVAAALLNYGNASAAALNASTLDYDAGTIDLLEFGSYLTDAGSTSSWYDTNVADNGEKGASWDDPIIIDSAEELVYLCKGSGNETAGLYYKVADGIAGFNLSTSALDITKSYEANESVIMNSGKNHAGNQPGFQGHFDGNGATVYGAVINSGGYAGLFSCTKGDVTIKNINVRLSRFVGKYASGGIVGLHEATMTATQAKNATTSSGALVLPENGSLTIENCSVADCYIESTGTGYGTGAAAILGFESNSWSDANITYASGLVDDSALTLGYYDADGNGKNTYYNGEFTINNCFVDLDDDKLVSAYAETNQAIRGGLAAYATTNAGVFKNCIVIGITPYSTYKYTSNNNHQHTALASHFSNIYTTAATGTVTIGGSVGTQDYTGKVTQLTTEQLTGLNAKENMTALDWDTVWTTTNGYPTFINKNYESSVGKTIYYTGTASTIGTAALTEGAGEKDNPYIINTVEELAWVVSQSNTNAAATQGKYFKVADGITSIVLQKADYVSDILALGSAAETKAYFEANAANMVKWPSSGSTTFCGNIDFNGATVYGLYQVSSNNAGLFSYIDAGAVISNLGIKNSYITSTATNWQIGAISAVSSYNGVGAKINGVIWTKNCTVANNYLHSNYVSESDGNNSRSGVLIGAASDTIYMDNMLVYGNDATGGDGSRLPIASTLGNAIPEGVEVPEGLVTAFAGQNSSGQNLHVNKLRNSIILGCDPYDLSQNNGIRFNDITNCYENVYTDADIANDTFPNGTAASGIKGATQVTNLKTLKGNAAASVVTTLNTDNTVGTWYVGNDFEYPGFKEASVMPSNIQAIYNGMVLDMYDDYGDSVASFGMYAPGLNLKVNPYMTFTFEFGGEYKQSENVVVTFKSGDTVIETVTAADMINNENAGRFHLYRLKSAPVTAVATGISVSVSVNGGAAVDFGTYSAEGFALRAENANKVQPCDYYATRYEAAKALLFYAQMLDARYGA